MAIYSLPGATFEAGAQGFPTGLIGTIGVRVLDTPAGTTVIARTTAGIAEQPAGSGYYTVSLTAPVTAGTYSVVWDTGSVTPDTTAMDELIVTHTLPAAGPAPSGIDLTTLSAVRSFMQINAADTEQDAEMSRLITRASQEIIREFEREFAPATASAAREFEYDGDGWLNLAPYDLRSVSLVRIDTDSSPVTTLTTDEYRLFPYPNPHGVFTDLRLQVWGGSPTRFRNRRVEITGAWGFATVPSDVEHWCIITVATWIRRDAAAFSTTFRLEDDRLERPEALPAAVRAGLGHYRRYRGS